MGDISVKVRGGKIIEGSRDNSKISYKKYKNFSYFIFGIKQSFFKLSNQYFWLSENKYTNYTTFYLADSCFLGF